MRTPIALVTLAAAPVLLLGGGQTAQGAPAVPTWQASIVDEDPLRSSGEPSIRVADDGTMYIVAPASLRNLRGLPEPIADGGSFTWRSDDGGATWEDVPNNVIGGGDADVVTGKDDEVYVSGLSAACVTVAASSDRGDTWTPNPVNCTDAPGDDRQWNDYHDGAVYTAFGALLEPRALYINRSIITAPAVVAGPTVKVLTSDHQWPGVLDVDPLEGTVYMAWNTFGSPNECDDDTNGCAPEEASKEVPDEIRIVALSSSDFGVPATIEPETILVASREFDTFDAFVGMDVSPQGAIYVVWNERHPEVKETWSMLTVSEDQGATWSQPEKVNTVGTTAFPWVTAGDDGRVMVTYYGTAAKGNSPETVNGDWRVYNAFSADGGATTTETVVTPNYMHQGAVCTSGLGCPTGTRDLIDFFETDVTPEGCLVVTYTDNSRDAVDASGVRSAAGDQPERISFAKQTGGPSLLNGPACGAGAPATPGPTGPTGGSTDTPTTPPTVQPRPPAGGPDLPATGGPDRLPLVAALVAGTAVAVVVRGRTSARRAIANTSR